MAAVERDQVVYFSKPLIPAKGFSCGRAVRPCLATTLLMTCMTIRFPYSGGELKLAGRDPPVPGLEGGAHLEALILDLLHALEGQGVGGM